MPARSASLINRAFEGVMLLKRATHIDQLNAEAGRQFADLGLPRFAVARFFKANRAAAVQVLAGSFDPRWAERYVARDYWRQSIIARELLISPDPYSWDEAMQRRGADEAQVRQRNEAREHGLGDGLFAPIRWTDGSYAAVVLGGANPELADPLVRTSAEILSMFYGSEARRLLASGREQDLVLSPRQRECLCWVRHGKSSGEIGEILGLSAQTVDEYVREACRKLGVRTRVQAVVDASLFGLLDN